MTEPTHWIDLPDARLAVDDSGPRDGSPVLLVHSAIVNRHAWEPVVPHLHAAGYRTIAYDMRGFGDSTTREVEYQPHSDVVAVLDHSGIERAAIAGNSMGGAFALDAVLESPERFVAYVWVGAGIGGYERDTEPGEQALFQAEGDAEDAGDWDLAAELDTRIWVDGWVDGVNQPTTRVHPEVRAAIKRWDRELLEPGRVYGDPKRPDPPAIGRLQEIRVPTLVAIGELDTSGTRAAAEIVAERVPGARIEHLPDVAHIIGMEAPERLGALMVEHLASIPRWR